MPNTAPSLSPKGRYRVDEILQREKASPFRAGMGGLKIDVSTVKLFLLTLNFPTPLFILAAVKRRKIAVAYLALVLAYVSVAYELRCIELLAEMCRAVWTNLSE